jgi:hypothetical protein
VFAAGTSLALVVTATPLLATPALAAPATLPARAPSTATIGQDEAAAQAKRTGKPVDVTGATTATSTLTANPNGSFTLTQAASPVRKKIGDAWTDLDATLTTAADGTLSPAVATGDLRLSGGGGGPLATMAGGGRSLALTLPFTLPKPAVDGPTATYRAVLPGVDLKVTANDQGGFAEVLVVADAAAAADPRLQALTMGLKTDGVTLSTDAAGNIAGTDINHHTVVTAPAPVMWDSKKPAAALPTVTEPSTGRKLEARSGLAASSSADTPGVAADVAPLGVALTHDKITLTPSKTMLAGATWPVYIDPTWSWGAATNGWAVIDNSRPATKYWKNSPSDQNDMQSGQNPDGGEVRRLLVNFPIDTSKLTKDAIISSATMNITETWSYNCTASKVDIYAPTSVVTSANAYWNAWAGVALGTQNDQINTAHGYSSSCPAAGVGFDVSTGIKAVAAAGRGNQTFIIKADSESSQTGWKRWSSSTPKLTVNYDHKPNRPSALHTSPTTSCTGASVVGDAAVKLYATVSDRDGGTLSENFTVWKYNYANTVKISSTLTNVASGSGSTPYTVAESWLKANSGGVPTKFGWNVSGTQNSLTSDLTASCYFTFDPTRPHAPEISDPPATATIGTPAPFTISYVKNAGETSVPASYQYQLNGGPIASVTADSAGSASISVIPMRTTDRLVVIGVSSGANIGNDTAEQVFTAAIPAPAADADLTGDGNADLLTPGGINGIPSGAWLAAGSGAKSAPAVNTYAVNIGNNGTGLNTTGSPAEFDGTQMITGRFTGTNLQDLLYYDPDTGSGGVLAGNNAGDPILPTDDNQHTISSGSMTDYAPTYEDEPLMLANAGNSSGQTTGYMDLIGVSGDTTDGYHLIYYPNLGGPVSFPMSYPLTTPAPDGTMGWNAWTITTAQRADNTTDMFLWNKTTGALWLWSGLRFADDGNGNPLLTYTATTLANGAGTTFNQGAAVTLRAADINKDGTPDLWTVGAAATATAWLVTNVANGAGTITAQPGQKLTATAHTWLLNDAESGVATTAHDYAGNLSLTGRGNASFSTGDMFSPDVTFNSTTSDAMGTASAAVNTAADFTISFWAKPDAYSGAALSVDGNNGPVLKVWPSADTTWKAAFQKTDATATASTWDTASAPTGTARLGFWTHVAVTYQASTKRLELYINDTPTAGVTRTGTYTANGKLQLGTMKNTTTTYGAYYDGQIAGVQTWTSVTQPVLLANWDMGGGSGTTVADLSGFANAGTLAGGYTWNTTGHNAAQNGSITLNGSTGYAQAPSALLQPATQSFSVAAWVYLTDTTASVNRTIVSQPGTNRAPFYLLYNSSANAWQFLFTPSDAVGDATSFAATDPSPAAKNTWVHVTGTYDVPTKTARLYVNGALVSTATGVTTFNATGKTFIGRSGGLWWQGKLDSVRIYQGVLGADQVRTAMNS